MVKLRFQWCNETKLIKLRFYSGAMLWNGLLGPLRSTANLTAFKAGFEIFYSNYFDTYTAIRWNSYRYIVVFTDGFPYLNKVYVCMYACM